MKISATPNQSHSEWLRSFVELAVVRLIKQNALLRTTTQTMIHFTRSLLLSFVVLIATVAPLLATPLTEETLPRKFIGSFQWGDGKEESPYRLVLTITKIEKKKQMLHLTGIHDYNRGYARMKVVGTIDLQTNKIVLKETEIIVDGNSEIEGQFLGSISADGRTLSAKWTTAKTGRKGSMKLTAK